VTLLLTDCVVTTRRRRLLCGAAEPSARDSYVCTERKSTIGQSAHETAVCATDKGDGRCMSRVRSCGRLEAVYVCSGQEYLVLAVE
jgi:hypothetical protein